jgi:hypothetical protein
LGWLGVDCSGFEGKLEVCLESEELIVSIRRARWESLIGFEERIAL